MDDPTFSRAAMRAAGNSDSKIDDLLDVGEWLRLRQGIYCNRSTYDTATEVRLRHALLICAAQQCLADDAVASMWSAAALHGLPAPRAPEGEVILTRRSSRPRRYPGLRVRVAQLPTAHLVTVAGVRATSPARTVVDLARNLPFIDGVTVADACLHHGLTTKDELIAVTEDCLRWPGIRRARDVVAFADAGAESPLESRSRVRLVHEHGLPPPVLNAVIRDHDGRAVARVDMFWPQYRTIGEADGAAKYEDAPDALFREKLREDEIRDLDFQVVRWTWWDIDHATATVVRRIRRAFHRSMIT